MHDIKIFTGQGSEVLGEAIVRAYTEKYDPQMKLGLKNFKKFSDGEFKSFPNESVRDSYVFFIQSTFMPAENLLELLMFIDAAKRASAYKVIAVVPYFGLARQDRKSESRAPISARLVADLIIAAGADRIITMDLHADQIQGFFSIPVDHLYASSLFVPYIKSLNLQDLVIAAPDMGASKRAKAYTDFLNKEGVSTEMVICYKERKRDNEVGKIIVLGNVKNKNVILLDDMIDTGGTMIAVCQKIKEKGAKSTRIMATHAVLSGDAHKNIRNACVEEVVLTDTIPLSQENPKIKIISIAEHFAEVIKNIYEGRSISESFIQRD